MSVFRNALRRVADTAIGDRLRTAMQFRPPMNIRPLQVDASVSDLFPWRVNEVWETRFEVTNTPSFLFPNESMDDEVTIIAFRSDGSEIDRTHFVLSPFETRPYLLANLVGHENGAVGTFSVFHHAPKAEKILKETKSLVAERGYLSFKRKGDTVWGVVHGNLHCLSKAPGGTQLDFAHGRVVRPEPYRLQLDMSDCRSFDLTFTNPSTKLQSLEVVYLSSTRAEIKRVTRVIPPRGIEYSIGIITNKLALYVKHGGPYQCGDQRFLNITIATLTCCTPDGITKYHLIGYETPQLFCAKWIAT